MTTDTQRKKIFDAGRAASLRRSPEMAKFELELERAAQADHIDPAQFPAAKFAQLRDELAVR